MVYRDLLDTKIMSCLMGRPSEIIRRFWNEYETSPEAATDYFYRLSQDSDYIRRYRISRDEKWVTPTPYGDLDITINLSKPEKDPKAIAAAKLARQSGYPKCLLCRENEGYAGRVNHPARQNHRIIPITVNSSRWGFQYSPRRVVQHRFQNAGQGRHRFIPLLLRRGGTRPEGALEFVQAEQLQQPVYRIYFILRLHQTGEQTIVYQFANFFLNHFPTLSFLKCRPAGGRPGPALSETCKVSL